MTQRLLFYIEIWAAWVLFLMKIIKITDFGFSKVKSGNLTVFGATNNVNGPQNWKALETYDESNLYTEKPDI